ncbi:MAG: sulfurtransferase [Alphaproteobacteria bacterium]|nr:sulfurtransferase [Alphaproteobacteria bacterium]
MAPLNLTVQELERLLRASDGPFVLDVREAWEVDICALPDSHAIALGELDERIDEIPRDRQIVVVCHHGMRSLQAVMYLRAQGFVAASNLKGGVDAWAREVDQTMATY